MSQEAKVQRLLIEWLDSARPDHTPSVVCLGFFDGVHLGHQAILGAAKAISQQKNLTFCVHTYDTMPARVLSPGRAVAELTPFEEKAALLEAQRAEVLAVSHFDQALMEMSGADFLDMLAAKLKARHLVAGYDHRFGHHGDTDAGKLTALCHQKGIGITIVEPVRTPDGKAISSTAIRAALAACDFAQAERMLGRPVSTRMQQLFAPDCPLP